MTIGKLLLLGAGLLVLFGAGQRVLDRLRLTDRQALLWIALILIGGFLPDIPVSSRFSFNLGGALIPLALSVWLWAKADRFVEKARTLAAVVLTAVAVGLLDRVLPESPEGMVLDPNYVCGLAAGLVAWLAGRSRRGAFVAGTLGVMLAEIVGAVYVWSRGVEQKLVLGGAGGYDVIVLSGLLAVLLCELTGEIAERAARGRRRPVRRFTGGDYAKEEKEP